MIRFPYFWQWLVYLLIPAAGAGRRMGSDRNKLLLPLLGQPILAWTLQAAAASRVEWIGLVGQPVDWPDIRNLLEALALPKPVQWILGGSTRQESVHNGLMALPPEADRVLIHDGARCLATPDLFDRCGAALEQTPGLIAAVPVKDTIKVVDGAQRVTSTPDRAQLWAAQTPQGFWVNEIKDCHDRGREAGLEVTDDAALFEHFGLPVQIVPGEETNLKVTTPMDLTIAEFILRQRSQPS
jgi:2-C-methyl-D-erythritol 4-phosphate cytidylyltransferase